LTNATFTCGNTSWNADAQLVFVGHTHAAIEANLGTFHIVNLGSVSNHNSADVRSSYVILETTRSSHTVERRFVDYDHQAAINQVRSVNHPAADFIIRHLAGEFTADWSNWLNSAS